MLQDTASVVLAYATIGFLALAVAPDAFRDDLGFGPDGDGPRIQEVAPEPSTSCAPIDPGCDGPLGGGADGADPVPDEGAAGDHDAADEADRTGGGSGAGGGDGVATGSGGGGAGLATPRDLDAVDTGDGVLATWRPTPGAATELQRSDAGVFRAVATVPAGESAWLDLTLPDPGDPAGTQYRVVAVDGARRSAPSDPVDVRPGPGIAAPSGLTATRLPSDEGAVDLRWTPIAGAASEVQRSADGAPYVALGVVPAGNGTFRDGDAPAGPVAYRIVAVDDGRRSAPGREAFVPALAGEPRAPAPPTGLSARPDGDAVVLGWVPTPGSDATLVRRGVGDGPRVPIALVPVTGADAGFVDRTVTPGEPLAYDVIAFEDGLHSRPGEVVEVAAVPSFPTVAALVLASAAAVVPLAAFARRRA